MSNDRSLPGFRDMGLSPSLVAALQDVGYEAPTQIQAECIPVLMAGQDLLGQAQTGTGKTAAFALPLLSRLDLQRTEPQVLVLAPTRELAIQVSEAFQTYARHLKGFHVLPIYGGQSYDIQLRQLKRGPQVIVGTPGRVMDHMRRGTLVLSGLSALVLDEADEMLRMGFIDDVKWVLEHTPDSRQIALFSATMPREIQRVAQEHLRDPRVIKIAKRTATAETIEQRYWSVGGLHKLDALTRLLEAEDFEAVLIFVRTKTATVELAEKLEARGHACEALNGDVPQAQRERIVERLRRGQLDVLVATDVVARGLDVERISHVINYDIPTDVDSYIHRIGRTGRAGRKGDAILFVAPRERYLLRAIETAIGQPITPMQMPSARDINQQRVLRFKQRVREALDHDGNEFFYQMLTELQEQEAAEPLEIAAALARLLQGDEPLLLVEQTRTDVAPGKAARRSEARTGRQDRPDARAAAPEKAVRATETPLRRRDRTGETGVVPAVAREPSQGGGEPRPRRRESPVTSQAPQEKPVRTRETPPRRRDRSDTARVIPGLAGEPTPGAGEAPPRKRDRLALPQGAPAKTEGSSETLLRRRDRSGGARAVPAEAGDEPPRRRDRATMPRAAAEKPFRPSESRPPPDGPGRARREERPEQGQPRSSSQALSLKAHPEVRMERFRLAVGREHGVKPANIVGAIANEAEIDSEYIGHIDIHETWSTVDLPEGMPKQTFNALKRTWVCQQRLDITRMAPDSTGQEKQPTRARPKAAHKPTGRPKEKARVKGRKSHKAGHSA